AHKRREEARRAAEGAVAVACCSRSGLPDASKCWLVRRSVWKRVSTFSASRPRILVRQLDDFGDERTHSSETAGFRFRSFVSRSTMASVTSAFCLVLKLRESA